MLEHLDGSHTTNVKIENLLKSENQQVNLKLTPAEWAWLAGLIDGEGFVGLYIRTKKHKKWEGIGVDLQVGITNTDMGIIEKFTDLLNIIGITPHTSLVSPEGRQIHESKYFTSCDCFSVRVNGMLRCYRFLLGIKDYLAGNKKHKTNLVLKFIERRLSYRGKHSKKGFSWYTKEDWEIVKEIYTMSKAGIPKHLKDKFEEILNDSNSPLSDDKMIESELLGDQESESEMIPASL